MMEQVNHWALSSNHVTLTQAATWSNVKKTILLNYKTDERMNTVWFHLYEVLIFIYLFLLMFFIFGGTGVW
jgi:hypothetical protein